MRKILSELLIPNKDQNNGMTLFMLTISTGMNWANPTGCLLPATILPVLGLLVIILTFIPHFQRKFDSSRNQPEEHLLDLTDLPQ